MYTSFTGNAFMEPASNHDHGYRFNAGIVGRFSLRKHVAECAKEAGFVPLQDGRHMGNRHQSYGHYTDGLLDAVVTAWTVGFGVPRYYDFGPAGGAFALDISGTNTKAVDTFGAHLQGRISGRRNPDDVIPTRPLGQTHALELMSYMSRRR